MGAMLKIGGGILLIIVTLLGFVGVKVGTAEFHFPDTPYPANIKASTDPAVIAEGEYIVHNVAHCSTCHQAGENLSHANLTLDRAAPLTGGFKMEAGPFGTFYPANLTPDPQTGIGRYTDEELARMIRNGVGKNGEFLPMMRIAVGPMSDADLTAVISYLRAQKPVERAVPQDEFGILAKLLSDSFSPRGGEPPAHVARGEEPSIARGEYLANGPGACVGCHSPVDPMAGFALAGPAFSGAGEPEPDPSEDGYVIVAPNLTSDPTGVTGKWSEDDFVKRMRAGRMLKGSKMAWEAMAGLSDADLRSLYRYLKSVPAVANDVGPTRRKG